MFAFLQQYRTAPGANTEAMCIAAIRAQLAAEFHETASRPTKPDREERTKPAVDARFSIGSRRFAIEHTKLPTYSGEFDADANWRGLKNSLEAMEDRLSRLVDEDSSYQAWLPAHPRIARADRGNLLALLEERIRHLMPTLGRTSPHNVLAEQLISRKSKMRVRLGRYSADFLKYRSTKHFHFERVPDFSESGERHKTILGAFKAKARKLALERSAGHVAVLVLEWSPTIATPYIPVLVAGKILQRFFRDSVDRVAVISTAERIWSIQHIDGSQPPTREIFKTNWWLYDPETERAWRRPWV